MHECAAISLTSTSVAVQSSGFKTCNQVINNARPLSDSVIDLPVHACVRAVCIQGRVLVQHRRGTASASSCDWTLWCLCPCYRGLSECQPQPASGCCCCSCQGHRCGLHGNPCFKDAMLLHRHTEATWHYGMLFHTNTYRVVVRWR